MILRSEDAAPVVAGCGLDYQLPSKKYETVDHPAHYNAYGVECITVAEQMSYNQGVALAYIWRCGLKPGVDPVEDLQKAIWHLQREIQRLQRRQAKSAPPAYHQAEVYGEK